MVLTRSQAKKLKAQSTFKKKKNEEEDLIGNQEEEFINIQKEECLSLIHI